MHLADEALETIVTSGYNLAFGARFLKRYIDEHIKVPMSARWKDGNHFDVTVRDGHLIVEPAPAGLPSSDDALALGA